MNIVWKKPDGSIAITVIGEKAIALMEAIRIHKRLFVVLASEPISTQGIQTLNSSIQKIAGLMADMRVTSKISEWADYNGLTPQEHADKVKDRAIKEDLEQWIAEGADPKRKPPFFDWEIVGFDIEVPTDRTFRNALEFNSDRIEHNIEKAKNIQHDRRREARTKELEPLDLQVNINIANPAKLAEIEKDRQSIRDKYAEIQVAIDAAGTVEELKAAL